jgi:hypothetical protein
MGLIHLDHEGSSVRPALAIRAPWGDGAFTREESAFPMSQEDAVAAIAEKLGEKDAIPLKQIGQVIEALGEARTMQLLSETMEIEAGGGMTVADGTRRRSKGGVFFHLVRKELSREWKQRIFYWQPEGAAKTEAPKEEAPVAPKARRPRIIEVATDLQPKPKRRSYPPPAKAAGSARDAASGRDMVLGRDAARERIRQALQGLPAGEQRELLLELIADIRPSAD